MVFSSKDCFLQHLNEFAKTIPSTSQNIANIRKFQYDTFVNSEVLVRKLAIQCDKIYGTSYSSAYQDNHSTNSSS